MITTDVKKYNKNRVFRLIHYAGKISRQEIADILGLSLPTVNQNLKMLAEDGLIEFVGNFASTGGRKAQAITVRKKAKCAISVNLLANRIHVALVDLRGEILCSVQSGVSFSDNEKYLQTMTDLIADVVMRNGIKTSSILGVGITIPGVLDTQQNIIVSAPTMHVQNYSIEKITARIPYHCIVMNDAKAHSYAEFWHHRKCTDVQSIDAEKFDKIITAKEELNQLYLMLGEGVGGSYITNEKIMQGEHNRYGEFGHMTIYPKGKRCTCGRQGCFEAYVSARCLSTELGISLEQFFEELEQHDSQRSSYFAQYIDDFTTGVNNLYTIYDCNIVIGGVVSPYLKPYEQKIRDILRKKYAFDTDAAYFHLAECGVEESDAGAALTFLGAFIQEVS